MTNPTPTRRDVNRLALAALGGLLSGCGGNPARQAGDTAPGTAAEARAAGLLGDPHVCRGINTCKNKGKAGTTNDCAGQGHCATAVAHSCHAENDCKGQGGCGEHPGENTCKHKGACGVPLSDKAWPKARQHFEELMTQAGKKFGDAPPKS
jgi:hypothetical protein